MILRLIAGALVAFGIVKLFKPVPTDAEIDERLLAKAGRMQGNLDPIHSIVDFLKVLEIDASRDARRELWGTLGLAGDYTGTAEQNIQLLQEMRLQLRRGDFADRL